MQIQGLHQSVPGSVAYISLRMLPACLCPKELMDRLFLAAGGRGSVGTLVAH